MEDVTTTLNNLKDYLEEYCISQIQDAVTNGKKFLEVDLTLMSKKDPSLVETILDDPEESIRMTELALSTVIKNNNAHYKEESMQVLFTNIPTPETPLSEISDQLNKLLAFKGYVVKPSEVLLKCVRASFECGSCGNIMHVSMIGRVFSEPSKCSCGRKGKFKLIDKKLVKYQVMELLEALDKIPDNQRRLSKKKVLLSNNLVRQELTQQIQPGTKVMVYGYLELEEIGGKGNKKSNEFKTNIVANNIRVIPTGWQDIKLTPAKIKKIREMAQKGNLLEEFAQSLCPTFEGYVLQRQSLILQHVGGKRIFDANGSLDEREIIHVLLTGSPGSGKTFLQKKSLMISPTWQWVQGAGLSKAGLVACISKDEFGSYSLEVGPLVLADLAIIGIDEMEKMQKTDYGMMNNAMVDEQTKITKANIDQLLKTRTCLDKATLIECIAGIKEIKDVSIGDIIYGLSDALKIIPTTVIAKRRSMKKTLEIVTFLGKRIICTPDHMLLTLRNGELKWLQAKDLNKNDLIGSIRRLPMPDKFPQIDFFDGRAVYKDNKIYIYQDNENKKYPAGIIYTGISRNMCYVAGLIFSDGYRAITPKTRIAFSNRTPELLYAFEHVMKQHGLNISRVNRGDGNHTHTVHGLAIYTLYNNIINHIGCLPKEYINDFICGVIDGEGHVHPVKKLINISTARRQDTSKIRSLLLKLGIVSFVKRLAPKLKFCINRCVQAKEFYYIEVNGKTLNLLENNLHFPKKRDLLFLHQNITDERSNGRGNRVDFVPVTKQFRIFRQKLGLTKKQLGTNLSNYETKFTRPTFQKMIQHIKNLTGHEDEYLNRLAASDIIWDNIKSIQDRDTREVYDIQTTCNNFIADDVVVHNCILATSNPLHKVFVDNETILKQLSPIPRDILDRFDVIWAMREEVNQDKLEDKYMARHTKSESTKQIWSNEEMREYISYAKKLSPIITPEIAKSFRNRFKKLTGGTSKDESKEESHRLRGNILRWAYAHSKFTLVGHESKNNEVVMREDSLEFAFNLLKHSFRLLGMLNAEGFAKYEILESIPCKKEVNRYYAVKDALKSLSLEYRNKIPFGKILERVKVDLPEMDVDSVDVELCKLSKSGEIFEPVRGYFGLL